MSEDIIISGLRQHNLKNVSLRIPKGKIVVFTGVSGSGKSSIVFDTIAAESQRQMNETYSAFIRNRLPKHKKPAVDYIDRLCASVIVDQSSLGGNARSTVGTISDLYSALRLLFSRIGTPHIGGASMFSFNDPSGMCRHCSGLGKVTKLNMDEILDVTKSWKEGCIQDGAFRVGTWYWKQYANSGLFDIDKPIQEYSTEEYHLLMYGNRADGEPQVHPKVGGIYEQYRKTYVNRDLSSMSSSHQRRADSLVSEELCPICHGKRLQQEVLSCKIAGYSISDMCEMEVSELYDVLSSMQNQYVEILLDSLKAGLKRMIDIGLPYLQLNRATPTLSGGEAQRLKLVRYMGSSLSDLLYIFDEPSTGLHPRDVYRMNGLLKGLRDKGNTVLVVEHDKDVISIADEIIDVGPDAGKHGGTIVFQGAYEELLKSNTKTAAGLRYAADVNLHPRTPVSFLPIRNACLHNLKHVDIDIPVGVMTVVSGVAGSGKSTLITKVFAKQYSDDVIMVDQSAITATSRSMPASYLGFFDAIRRLFAKQNQVEDSWFSFNSKGGCPHCKGKGVVVTELVYMDPMVSECEECRGNRYSDKALQYVYKGKNIMEVLSMSVEEALSFFEESSIIKNLHRMKEAGLGYLTLGQPLSTLSGGERQRVKLAKHLHKKGSIYVLDEPTTGLHVSDIQDLMRLFQQLVDQGNTVIIIEHNLDVMKQADWIIDIGPDGGSNGGQVMFSGTPKQMYDEAETITAACMRSS